MDVLRSTRLVVASLSITSMGLLPVPYCESFPLGTQAVSASEPIQVERPEPKKQLDLDGHRLEYAIYDVLQPNGDLLNPAFQWPFDSSSTPDSPFVLDAYLPLLEWKFSIQLPQTRPDESELELSQDWSKPLDPRWGSEIPNFDGGNSQGAFEIAIEQFFSDAGSSERWNGSTDDFSSNLSIETHTSIVDSVVSGFEISVFGLGSSNLQSEFHATLHWSPLDDMQLKGSIGSNFSATCSWVEQLGIELWGESCELQAPVRDSTSEPMVARNALYTWPHSYSEPVNGQDATFELNYQFQRLGELTLRLRHHLGIQTRQYLNSRYQSATEDCKPSRNDLACAAIAPVLSPDFAAKFNLNSAQKMQTDIGFSYVQRDPMIGDFELALNVAHVEFTNRAKKSLTRNDSKLHRWTRKLDNAQDESELAYSTQLSWRNGPLALTWKSSLVRPIEGKCDSSIFRLSIQWSAQEICATETQESESTNGDPLFYQSVVLGYGSIENADKLSYIFGVENLFDVQAPTQSSMPLGAEGALDQLVSPSRYVYFKLRLTTGN